MVRGLFGKDVKPLATGKHPCILVEAAEGHQLVLEGARADDNVGIRAVFFDAPLTLDSAEALQNDLGTGTLAASVKSGLLASSALPAGTRHFLANENLLVSDPNGFPVLRKLLLFGENNGKVMYASVKLRECPVAEESPAE